MNELFYYVVSLNIIVLLLILYSNLRLKKPSHSKSPLKYIIIHLALLIGLFVLVVDKAVRYAQIGSDDAALAIVALFFVAISFLLLIFKSLVEKINYISIIASLLILDLFEYLVISHLSFQGISWLIVNHILLLICAHFLAFRLLFSTYKIKIV